MDDQQNVSRNETQTAQEINQKICQWWQNREKSELSRQEITELIQNLSNPLAVWYCLPEQAPYNSMEAWCEGELGCEASFFLDTVQSLVGEEALSDLRDRRLSAIFRPFS